MADLSITVLIPAHNEEHYLERCLESILACRTPSVREIIVVDNASTDRTAAVAGSFPGVTVLHEGRKGITRARQCGLRTASGDLIACVDADSLVDRRWFETIDRTFRESPLVSCLTGPYLLDEIPFPYRILAWSYWNLLALPISLLTGGIAVGGNVVIRRSVLESIGGFDTTVEFYGEDTNLARRIKKVGRIRFSPRFTNVSSSRRMLQEGFFRTGLRYAMNFLSQTLFRRSVNATYRDIR